MSYFEQVRDIIVDSISIDADAITIDSDLRQDLEIDSLDAVELVMAVEEKFDIEIEEDAVAEIATVGDIVKIIEEKLG